MKNLIFCSFLLFTLGCSSPELDRDELIYSNTFETSTSTEIDGGLYTSFNGSQVIGNYNNDGFTVHLEDLGNHEYVYVSFDLYIHGSWDGNFNGLDPDQPDLWVMELRPDTNMNTDNSFESFKTTFSNSPCFSNYCLRQSYPNEYPFENSPKRGASSANLGAMCVEPEKDKTTTKYTIEKGFRHSGDALFLRFYDELFQPNAIDANGESTERCDESWSMDNLKIRVISYK